LFDVNESTISYSTGHISYDEVIKLKGYNSKSISGKLRVHRYLATDESLKLYLPQTTSFTEGHLKQMAKRFPTLYIKPNYGSQGIGIFKVERESNGYRLRSSSNQSKFFKQLSSIYQNISTNGNKHMIIQQGIDIERVNKRPYDIRAMVQRKPKGSWTCTGIFGKIGYRNKIVTNYAQGGQIVTMGHLFKMMGLSSSSQARTRHMTEVSLEVARVLNSKQSGMFEMGVDLSYDKDGHLWILEVNSRRPQFFPMKKVDRTMYNRMLSYANSYGRKSG
jgi:glutathione synthase/RimK-type ligase-like ATP-grasp enzyme